MSAKLLEYNSIAKFDTYTLKVQLTKATEKAELEITVLFEDGDNIATVIQSCRDRLRSEAILMKNTEFIKNLGQ